MERQRMDRILASTGRWSRREAKDLIRQGRVLLDGRPVRTAEEKADPAAAVITVGGEVLEYRRYTWVMLNKPAGYLSATEDGRGPTVLDLLPEDLRRRGLFPVGRLDRDTEGLLLLTNEGGLAHDLLSPKRHVDKVYYARVRGRLTEADRRAFAAGRPCMPARRAGDSVGGGGERGACHPPGGEVPPGEADAGPFGKAGSVSGAGADGAAGAGSGASAGCISLFDGE